MSYKIVLGLAAGRGSDVDCLTVCAELAKRFAAEGRVISAAPDPAYDVMSYDWLGAGFLDPELLIKVDAARSRVAGLIHAAMDKAVSEAGLPRGKGAGTGSITLAEGGASPWEVLQNEAPFADLAVIGRSEAADTGALTTSFSDLLMDLRVPVLIANGRRSPIGGTAVVAWDGSMEAGRAVKAAMPLLILADRVIVAQRLLVPRSLDGEAADTQRCARYLRRHGVADPDVMEIPRSVPNDGFMAAINETGTDLVVSGAYGHPRWQETIFGGVTRSLFGAEAAPHVLVSH